MKELVTKASTQVEKIKVAEAQVMKEVVFMEKAYKERHAEIKGFFKEVRHLFYHYIERSRRKRNINQFLITYEFRLAFLFYAGSYIKKQNFMFWTWLAKTSDLLILNDNKNNNDNDIY